MRQFDEILATIRRFAPTLTIHALLFVWLSFRVLDPAQIPDGNTFWLWLSVNIDRSLGAVGLSLDRWWVLAALLLAYLAAFEWLRAFVTTLPLLRVFSPWRIEPDLLARASVVFAMEPDYSKVSRALHKQTESANRQAMAANQRRPFAWLFDREGMWRSYYGTLLVALLAVLAWRFAGVPGALSTSRVWELALLLLLAGCLFTRMQVRRAAALRDLQMGHWALEEYERANPAVDDPLGWARGDVIMRRAKAERATRRHPSWILARLADRLPPPARAWVRERIARLPVWEIERDWELVASQKRRFADERATPPAALRTDAFADRFAALLECEGAGLCVLVPFGQASAPAARSGGSTYSLATRRHDWGDLAIQLSAGDTLAGASLSTSTRTEGHAFIAEIGEWPIARLAQMDFPGAEGQNWHRLLAGGPDAPPDAEAAVDENTAQKPIPILDRADLKLGSSYFLGVRTALGTRAPAVFQCFGTPGERVLLAWRILRVDFTQARFEPLAWYWPSAWKGLWRTPPSGSP